MSLERTAYHPAERARNCRLSEHSVQNAGNPAGTIYTRQCRDSRSHRESSPPAGCRGCSRIRANWLAVKLHTVPCPGRGGSAAAHGRGSAPCGSRARARAFANSRVDKSRVPAGPPPAARFPKGRPTAQATGLPGARQADAGGRYGPPDCPRRGREVSGPARPVPISQR